MTTPHKLGVLVAIPIKGRKLINRTGSKQSPYVQLKLGEQKKRTRASLIASVEPEWDQEASPLVRLDVFHGQLDMHVSVYDEGKKNELIGEGVLLLNEVIDKGELDVWFPIKHGGNPGGDIYFELTFYAAAPPPVAGSTPPPAQAQIHPPIRHSQPGFQGGPNMHPVPHTPPTSNYGSPGVNNMHTGGPPAPYPGNMYQHPGPGGFNPGARPFPPAQHQAFPPQPNPSPYGGPPASGPGFNPQYGNANNAPFRPPLGGAGMPGGPFPNNVSPQFGNTPIAGPYGAPAGSGPPQGPNMGGYPNHMPHMPQPQPFNQGGNNNNNNSYPPQSNSSNSSHNSTNNNMPSMYPGFPQGPGGGPSNSYPNNAPNSYPNHGPNNNNNNFANNRPPNSYPANNNFNNGNNPNPNYNNNNNNLSNNNNNNNNLSSNNVAPGQAPVTPLMQYNYSLGSFP
ncbi:hypothetical protein BGZ72_006199 [Mortierella alpina]|nr:hypothetical protein BGZ72_006199 [Mortierella alpina]